MIPMRSCGTKDHSSLVTALLDDSIAKLWHLRAAIDSARCAVALPPPPSSLTTSMPISFMRLPPTVGGKLLDLKGAAADGDRSDPSRTEENKEGLRKSRGGDNEGFHIMEYHAHKGNAVTMYRMGLLYYYGLKGVRRDYAKAVYWFSKAVEKGDPRVMELLGEIYARGAGVERNHTKAFEWITLASRQQYYSAYNGLGYLHIKGYGVEKKNFTKVRSSKTYLLSTYSIIFFFIL